MANAIPVSSKAAPKTQAEQGAADQKAVEAALIPVVVPEDEALAALAAEARSAGKSVIVYANAIRVDN